MFSISVFPLHIGLSVIETQVQSRHHRTIISALVVFAAIIVLKSRLQRQATSVGKSVFCFHFRHVVLHLLVRIVDLSRPRIEIHWLTYLDALAKQIFVSHLCAIKNSNFRGEQTVISLYFPLRIAPTEGHRTIHFAHASVVEQITSGAAVATIYISSLNAPSRISSQERKTLTQLLRKGKLSSVCAVKSAQFSHQFSLTIRQQLSFHQHDTAECFRTIAHTFCTFHHGDASRCVSIQFGRMIHTPLLSLLSHPIVDNQQTIAIHAVHHGLCYRSSRLNHTHSRHLREHFCESSSQVFGNLCCTKGAKHCILRVHHTLFIHHSLIELIAHQSHLHAQRLVVAHFIHCYCQR